MVYSAYNTICHVRLYHESSNCRNHKGIDVNICHTLAKLAANLLGDGEGTLKRQFSMMMIKKQCCSSVFQQSIALCFRWHNRFHARCPSFMLATSNKKMVNFKMCIKHSINNCSRYLNQSQKAYFIKHLLYEKPLLCPRYVVHGTRNHARRPLFPPKRSHPSVVFHAPLYFLAYLTTNQSSHLFMCSNMGKAAVYHIVSIFK
ncbi:hypothetical protein V8B55DRAFT_1341214 [Mucor lusitanicus]|uniref:Uncharacterized protein n=1 Tax=Mucor circinelloides f. lusitanicus TaxID=29924 RepID=A0A8H4BDZ0_MUCCL|nr:hypothetical protein FB192DRAFT_1388029 [Mucor lusitanicus]